MGATLMALSAHGVLERYADRRLTPSEYLAASLERIAQVNPKINALTAIDAERAVGEAVLATGRWRTGTPKGPLDGLPVGVKDLQDTKGLLTTHGSPRMRANCPKDDMPLVARLRAAGAIILAKTNVPECGAGGKTVAEHCEKGMKVLVHGRIHYTKWIDSMGNDRYGCEIIAEKVDFLSRPKSAENENPELVDRDDEIPF